ncbi:unnamed protein product, partial [marine sediment metagenome]
MKGEIPSLLQKGRFDEARQVCLFYQDLYKDDFYLEVQDTGLEEQKEVNQALVQLSRELSIPLVATNDVHYLYRKDARTQDVLLCIQTGKTLKDTDRLKFASSEFYFRSPEEMGKVFSDLPEAISNSRAISEKCNLKLDLGKIHLPHYQIPSGYDLNGYLKKLCQEGVSNRYATASSTVLKRLEVELNIIGRMGYAGYFLVVWDFARYAKEKQILVGPGRGSVTGSL